MEKLHASQVGKNPPPPPPDGDGDGSDDSSTSASSSADGKSKLFAELLSALQNSGSTSSTDSSSTDSSTSDNSSTDNLFASLDSNGDGSVSKAELQTFLDNINQQMNQGTTYSTDGTSTSGSTDPLLSIQA